MRKEGLPVKYYLIEDYGGVHLEVLGPYESRDQADSKAARLKLKNGGNYEYFSLIISRGKPIIEAYAWGYELGGE